MNSLRQHLREQLWAVGAGVDFASDLQLDAAIKRRQHQCNTSDERAYEALLIDSEQEQAALLDELLIRETSFFRDQTPFRLLVKTLRNSEAGVDILCVPCASGEEPYSIAITLLEAGFCPETIRIEAIDISTRGLLDAHEGCYTENRLRLVSPEQKRRYFQALPDGRHKINDTVRSCVRFAQMNALNVCEHYNGGGFDTIFCRNLMIYLRSECRDALLDSLTRLLKPEGLLFVGHAEAGLLLNRGYSSAGPIASFAFRRHLPTPVRHSQLKPQSVRVASPELPEARTEQPQLSAVLPPSESRNRTIAMPSQQSESGSTIPGLTDIIELADTGHYTEAQSQLLLLLQQQPDLAEAHSLLGLIRKAQGDLPGAIASLEKALYLDGCHHQSIEHLTLLYQAAGDQAGLARMHRKREKLNRDHYVR